MAVGKRLSKVAREFNVGLSTIVEFLHKKGFDVDANPNTKVSEEMFTFLDKEYKSDSVITSYSIHYTKLYDTPVPERTDRC